METRQQNILKAVIQEYNLRAQPVSSQILVRKYRFSFSPATVRLEMMDLTDQDYLSQPHTSAGRVPTDKAYRFFVEELMKPQELPEADKKDLKKNFGQMRDKKASFNKRLAELIAFQSHCLGINREEGISYEAGLNWLLQEPEFYEHESFVNLLDSFSRLENLFAQFDDDFKIFIGEENLGRELRDCSLVVRVFESLDGEKNVLGVLGPRRMNYARNISLLDYVAKLLEN